MPYIQNPEKFADKFKTKSSRLNNWDYSTPGFYFITIKTLNDNNFFGKIIDGKIELSTIGEIANQYLIDISEHFSNVILDEFIVMPNHVHILFLVETPDLASLQINKNNITRIKLNQNNIFDNTNYLISDLKETPDLASLHDNRKIALMNYSHNNHPDFYNRLNQKSKQLIPKIIQQYKSSVKRICNQNNLFFGWQSRYYDQIIKSEIELNNIRQYIKKNPINWQK